MTREPEFGRLLSEASVKTRPWIVCCARRRRLRRCNARKRHAKACDHAAPVKYRVFWCPFGGAHFLLTHSPKRAKPAHKYDEGHTFGQGLARSGAPSCQVAAVRVWPSVGARTLLADMQRLKRWLSDAKLSRSVSLWGSIRRQCRSGLIKAHSASRKSNRAIAASAMESEISVRPACESYLWVQNLVRPDRRAAVTSTGGLSTVSQASVFPESICMRADGINHYSRSGWRAPYVSRDLLGNIRDFPLGDLMASPGKYGQRRAGNAFGDRSSVLDR